MNGGSKERVEAPNEGRIDGSRRHDKERKDKKRERRIKVGDGSRRDGGREAALTLCRHASLQMVRTAESPSNLQSTLNLTSFGSQHSSADTLSQHLHPDTVVIPRKHPLSGKFS